LKGASLSIPKTARKSRFFLQTPASMTRLSESAGVLLATNAPVTEDVA